MPVSLGRMLRRIGIPPKAQRSEDWTVDKDSTSYKVLSAHYTEAARDKRALAFAHRDTPKKEHRRSKARR